MGTLYNGYGLNTTEYIRSGPAPSNQIQLRGWVEISDDDPVQEKYLVWGSGTQVQALNYQTSSYDVKPLELPAGASITQIYLKNLSYGKSNPIFNPDINPTYIVTESLTPTQASSNAWELRSSGAIPLFGQSVWVAVDPPVPAVVYQSDIPAYQPDANPQLNTGILYQKEQVNVDDRAGFQNVVLVNDQLPGSAKVSLKSFIKPPQKSVIVEVLIFAVVQ